MTLQTELEDSIRQVVDTFLQAPYRFFTEADAIVCFDQLLQEKASINQNARTSDGYEVSLIHREYPTFFRFDGKDPLVRLSDQASRGHYDVAILNPLFVEAHGAQIVTNRNDKIMRGNVDRTIAPLQAVIEFKLDHIGWSKNRAMGIQTVLSKLHLSKEEAELRYLVILMRYTAPGLTRWTKYWQDVRQYMVSQTEIRSVIAIN